MPLCTPARGLRLLLLLLMHTQELAHSIMPMIDSKFEELDETSFALLQAFFDRYGQLVAYNCAQRTRDAIASAHPTLQVPEGGSFDSLTATSSSSSSSSSSGDNSMVQFSLRWLQAQKGVSTVLVGMHQPHYVESALRALQR
jgi:predicted aldo/keto reductase-like oxidoreductase